jgi:hypothetical protein
MEIRMSPACGILRDGALGRVRLITQRGCNCGRIGAALLQIHYRSSACNPSGVISYLPSRAISQPDLTISSPVCKEQAG